MHKRLLGAEPSTISVGLAVLACWGCSGGSNTTDTGGGGSNAAGGASTGAFTTVALTASGGATSGAGGAGTGGAATGGEAATGGRSSNATGGAIATGGRSGQGGSSAATGGVSPTGGKSSKAGSSVAMGGESPTGGKSSTGGTTGNATAKAETGGSTSSGGSNVGGVTSATGGTKAASGGTTGVGGVTGTGGGSSASCPATVMKSGDSNQTVKVGSVNRTYILHIPTGYTGAKPLPLVVDFHPLGGTGSSQKTLSGWDKKGDANMFITAFPDSAPNESNAWNVGMCCQNAQQHQVDDVGFVKAMIEQIEGLACVDPKRIYASGCSNGGGMTYKVACDLADIFAAGAPVDFRCVYGGMTASPSCAGCQPKRPISIIHFDNTGDTSLVPYNGGMTSFAADCPPNQSCTGMGFPSAADNFKTWEGFDQCTGSVAPKAGSCVTNSTCQGGTEMTICVQNGGSHCGNYSTLKIVDTAWTEFQKLSLP